MKYLLLTLVSIISLSAQAQFGFFHQWNPRCLGNTFACIISDRIASESKLGDGGTVTNIFNASNTNSTGLAQQTTSANRPTYKLHNVVGGNAIGAGHNSIRFDGSAQYLYFTNQTLPSDISVYLVISNASVSGIVMEQSINSNVGQHDGFYMAASSASMWHINKAGNTQDAPGVANYFQNKFRTLDFIYPLVGNGTNYTNGISIANGTVSGVNVGNVNVTDTVYLMSRSGGSVAQTSGDIWYLVGFTSPHTVDDANRVRWWERRTYHVY